MTKRNLNLYDQLITYNKEEIFEKLSLHASKLQKLFKQNN